MEDKLTEQVKIALIKLMDNLPIQLDEKLSVFLSKKLNQDYSKISKVFSFTQGITIEKYYINSNDSNFHLHYGDLTDSANTISLVGEIHFA